MAIVPAIANDVTCNSQDYWCMTDVWVEGHSGLIGLVSLILAIIFFFWQHQREKQSAKDEFNERFNTMIDSMLIDLKIIEEAFGPKKYDKDKKYNVTYTQIGTEVYDGLLSSDLFTYLKEVTQKELGNLYFNIKLHNRALTEKTRYAMEFDLEYGSKDKAVYEKVNDKYGEIVEGYENEIKRLLPIVNDYLQKDKKL